MKTNHNNPGTPKDELPESIKKYLEDKSPFEVPENYFEEMTDKLNQRIAAEPKHEETRTRKIKRLNWAAGIAASIALTVFISVYLPLIKKGTQTGIKEAMAERTFSQAVLDDYILENTDESEIEEELIHDPAFSPFTLPLFNIDDDTIPEMKINNDNKAAAQIMADTTLSADDLLEYLNNEGYEPEDE